MIPYSRGICCKCNAETVIVKRLPSGHYCHKHNQERLNEGKEKKQYQIPKESKKRGKENREYLKIRKAYLAEHPGCEANVIDQKGEFICKYYATEIHHKAGKIGKLLTDTSNFLATCRPCHEFIEKHPRLAKKYGYSRSRLESKQEIIPLNE